MYKIEQTFIADQKKPRKISNFTGKGTFRQVFIRVYRLEKVFSTQLCELLPL
jgi:hypothetical protein